MGLIRLILATAVMFGHNFVFGDPFIRPELAVELFFIMSGFYMALVLNTKYADDRRGNLTFVRNRLLKLFPIYYLALIIALVSFDFHAVPAALNLFSKLFFILVNLIILGTDLSLFLGVNAAGALFFTKDFAHTSLPAEHFMLVAPAWSISVELIFYGIAIWLLRKRLWLLAGVFTLSLLIKVALLRMGYSEQPFNYMFWPAELCCFVAGALVCRIFIVKKVKPVGAPIAWAIYAASIVAICTHQKIGAAVAPTSLRGQRFVWLSLFLFALAIPPIFKLLKASKVDRFLGDFSYPVYILHGPINVFYQRFLFQHPEERPWLYGFSYVLGVFFVSLFALRFIERPLERRLRRAPEGVRSFSDVRRTPFKSRPL